MDEKGLGSRCLVPVDAWTFLYALLSSRRGLGLWEAAESIEILGIPADLSSIYFDWLAWNAALATETAQGPAQDPDTLAVWSAQLFEPRTLLARDWPSKCLTSPTRPD